jgi:hypothetical protein
MGFIVSDCKSFCDEMENGLYGIENSQLVLKLLF